MLKKLAGSTSLTATIIIATATILASALGALATSSASNAEIRTKVEVVKTTEELHYKEVKEGVDSLNRKMDRLLEKQNMDNI